MIEHWQIKSNFRIKESKHISARMKSVFRLHSRYSPDHRHDIQVRDLALQLFEELQTLHGLKSAEKELLEAASLLHDVGWSISGSKHHKHAMDLIMKHGLAGWNMREVQLIANIARYHRKAFPLDKHPLFKSLSDGDKLIVKRLSSLLRIADGLDRSHTNAIARICCEQGFSEIKMTLMTRGNCDAEIYGFEKKRDLFEHVFCLPIIIGNIMDV